MQLLTIPQVAQRLGLSERSIKNPTYRQRIGLPIVRIGTSVRIAESDLQTFIDQRRVVVPAEKE